MNKSTIEAGQPEQVTVNEQKADIIPSAQVSANALVGRSLVELPNKFFYYVAKQFLKSAYSEKVSSSFFSFEIERRNFNKTRAIKIRCSNGGASMNILVRDNGIVRTGDYSKHRNVNGKDIVSNALKNIDKIKPYYSVKFQENIDCYQRCVNDVEEAKKRVIQYWNKSYSTSQIKEPINWVIREV